MTEMAPPLPESAPDTQRVETVSLVTMRVGEATVAVDSSYVEQIALTGPVTAIPRSPAHIEGLVLIGSQAVPILDAAVLLGLARTERPDPRWDRLVVVEVEDLKAAVRTSQASVVDDVPRERLRPATSVPSAKLERFTSHEAEIRGVLTQVLDLPAVLKAARTLR